MSYLGRKANSVITRLAARRPSPGDNKNQPDNSLLYKMWLNDFAKYIYTNLILYLFSLNILHKYFYYCNELFLIFSTKHLHLLIVFKKRS